MSLIKLTAASLDPYDIRFGRGIAWDSPSIWDNDRQDFIKNVMPVPVHSHNDYTRRIPLFEALGSGCISVEADVYLHDGDLLVGHKPRGLHRHSNLRSMYLDPLQRLLESRNAGKAKGNWHGIFNKAPQQTVVLLVDHKTEDPKTFGMLHAQLQSLRDLEYLTYWNGTHRIMGPLTIVASGNVLLESIIALDPMHRDIFWDARLETLISAYDDFSGEMPVYGYNQSNSYYASGMFRNARLYGWHDESRPPPSTPAAKDSAMSQIDQAKARGLISRYWGTPDGPQNLKEIVWRVLVKANVGVLNMDDLGTVRARAPGWGAIAS